MNSRATGWCTFWCTFGNLRAPKGTRFYENPRKSGDFGDGGEGRNRAARAFFWAILAQFNFESVRIGAYRYVSVENGLVLISVLIYRANGGNGKEGEKCAHHHGIATKPRVLFLRLTRRPRSRKARGTSL